MAPQMLVPSENWDDDFEFNSTTKKSPPRTGLLHPRLSVASHLTEDWDAEPSPKLPTTKARGMSTRLDHWAEPGPSTPTKPATAHAQTENWDDDFEDKADSPPGRLGRHHPLHPSIHAFQHNNPSHPLRTRHSYHTPPRPKPRVEPENWDDDFDDPMSSTSPTKADDDNTPMTKRTRKEAYADSSDEDEDFGFSDDKEEDKTLTARSRTAPMLRPPSVNLSSNANLPLPPLPRAPSLSPIDPFPRSPTVSVFSIPTTSGRNSIGHFNSTSHLVLSGASSLAMLPPSPPALRERRRLRKKSRPPHMDNNVFELIEEPYDSSPPPLPPSTPDRVRATSPLPTALPSPLEATPASGGSKTPLLSRIGSVKKWNVRRKRASTGPAEVIMQEPSASDPSTMDVDGASRPPSSLDQTQAQSPSNRNRNSNHTGGGMRSGWFFRPGGAHCGAGSPPPRQAELKHERSLDHTRLRPGAGDGANDGGSGRVPTTPSKSSRFSRRKASGTLEYTSSGDLTGGDASSSASGVIGLGKPSLGLGRRPSSMQVPNGASLALGGGKFGSIGTRHTSYGSSVGRASSSRMFSTPTPSESADHLPPVPALPSQQEASRGFMGSVRKISLVGGKKHSKQRASVELAQTSLQDDVGDDMGRGQDADADPRMQTPPQARTPDLLPPIELHPPSPPRPINGVSAANSIPLHFRDDHEPLMPSTSSPSCITMTPLGSSMSPGTPIKTTPKSPSSPQSASLGRTTQVPNPPTLTMSVPRRNSLGDLKIPSRISQAQIGLKRDLGMVREFAASVDTLKELQSTYHQLLSEAQTFFDNVPPSRATSPVFNLVRSRSRLRSNTSPSNHASSSSPAPTIPAPDHGQIAATLHAITNKYKVPWECAELLIELGGGAPVPASPPPSGASSSLSAPIQAELDRRKNRERAVTLSGEESKPSSTVIANNAAPSSTSDSSDPSWGSSTGRHDLSQRQLMLLRDMLSNGELPADDSPQVEEKMNRNWRWGDGMNSTITLPSEDSDSRGVVEHDGDGVKKKRRGTRLGLMGLRDMLRMLKRSRSEHVAALPVPAPPAASTVSLSTDSSHYSHHYPHGRIGAGRGGAPHLRPQTSSGFESVRSNKDNKDTSANSPYGEGLSKSPRRPSLASIFRLGQKSNKSTSFSSQDSRSDLRSDSRGSTRTEEDWDRIESAIDLDGAARALGIEGSATVKGRNKGRPSSPFLSESLPHSLPHASVLTQQLTHRPVTPRRAEAAQVVRLEVEASPRSIRPMRSTRLSNVQEVSDGEQRGGARSPSGSSNSKAKNRVTLPRTNLLSQRPPSRGGSNVPAGASGRTGSVRSAPPTQPLEDGGHAYPLVPHLGSPEIKLSMTPENIKPLLESAKEVHMRCRECIRELHVLLGGPGPGPGPAGGVFPVSAS